MTPNARRRHPRRGRFQTCPPLPSVRIRLRRNRPPLPAGAGFKPARPYRRCVSGCGAIARHPRRGRFQTCPPPPAVRVRLRGERPPLPQGQVSNLPAPTGGARPVAGRTPATPVGAGFKPARPYRRCASGCGANRPPLPAGAGFKPARPYRRCASGCGANRPPLP